MSITRNSHPWSGEGGFAVRWLLPLALLAFGFWLLPYSQTCKLGCFPGDLGDARFNDVVLEHFYRWLTGKESSLLSPSFFYPMPGALTFSDNHWGTAWLYSIYRALGWDRYEAFDLWYMSGYVANFLVSNYVFRKLRFSPLASALAAFAFTFAMPVTAKYGHAQLLCRFLIPVGLLMWQRFRESGSWRWLGWMALAVTGQFYISIYLGYFMLMFLAAWGAAQWAIEGWGPRAWFAQWRSWSEPTARRELVSGVIMALLAVAALAFLMEPYLHYSKVYGFQRSPIEIASMLPRPKSYLIADGSTIWGSWSIRHGTSVPMRGEHQMFFGLGMLGLAAFALFRSTLRMRWVALLSILLLVLVTLSSHGHSLYMHFARLPGVDSIRAVSRIGLVMTLPLALLVAMAVDAVGRSAVRLMVVVPLALFMMCESVAMHVPSTDTAQARQRIVDMAAQLPSPLPSDAILFNPGRPDAAFFVTELDGVILGQDMNRPTLNGYSGNSPPGYDARGTDFACLQATIRLRSAQAYFANPLHGSMPAGAGGPIVIVGEPPCSPASWDEIKLDELDRVTLRIVSIERDGGQYKVRVMIHNGAQHALNTTGLRPNPLRLSWQKLQEGQAVDPDAWVARVNINDAGAIPAGQDHEVSFDVPVSEGERVRLAVSGVLEGRAWLQDHGVEPAILALDNGP